MPQTTVKLNRLKTPGDTVKITLRLEFKEDDPKMTEIFQSVAKLVCTVLDVDESRKFLEELRRQWQRVKKAKGVEA